MQVEIRELTLESLTLSGRNLIVKFKEWTQEVEITKDTKAWVTHLVSPITDNIDTTATNWKEFLAAIQPDGKKKQDVLFTFEPEIVKGTVTNLRIPIDLKWGKFTTAPLGEKTKPVLTSEGVVFIGKTKVHSIWRTKEWLMHSGEYQRKGELILR